MHGCVSRVLDLAVLRGVSMDLDHSTLPSLVAERLSPRLCYHSGRTVTFSCWYRQTFTLVQLCRLVRLRCSSEFN